MKRILIYIVLWNVLSVSLLNAQLDVHIQDVFDQYDFKLEEEEISEIKIYKVNPKEFTSFKKEMEDTVRIFYNTKGILDSVMHRKGRLYQDHYSVGKDGRIKSITKSNFKNDTLSIEDYFEKLIYGKEKITVNKGTSKGITQKKIYTYDESDKLIKEEDYRQDTIFKRIDFKYNGEGKLEFIYSTYVAESIDSVFTVSKPRFILYSNTKYNEPTLLEKHTYETLNDTMFHKIYFMGQCLTQISKNYSKGSFSFTEIIDHPNISNSKIGECIEEVDKYVLRKENIRSEDKRETVIYDYLLFGGENPISIYQEIKYLKTDRGEITYDFYGYKPCPESTKSVYDIEYITEKDEKGNITAYHKNSNGENIFSEYREIKYRKS